MGMENGLLLKKFDLWSVLTDDEYKELHVLDNYKEFKEGEFVYFEAFNHNLIYFIKNGYIRIGYLDKDGKRIIKDILKPGDFFGQISLESSNLNGEFAQTIKSDVSLCSFTIDNFVSLLRTKPQLAIKYSKLTGLRMKRFENRLINILQKDARTRLLLFLNQLLQESRNKKQVSQTQIHIPNFLTHDEIGQLTGISRQTVTTLLNELKESGILVLTRKELRILDLSRFPGHGNLPEPIFQ
jgi:CRP/FNR family transcriptional regulator, cyclic AMP receptor protein